MHKLYALLEGQIFAESQWNIIILKLDFFFFSEWHFYIQYMYACVMSDLHNQNHWAFHVIEVQENQTHDYHKYCAHSLTVWLLTHSSSVAVGGLLQIQVQTGLHLQAWNCLNLPVFWKVILELLVTILL